jgi:hypothetical protein
MLLSSWPSKIGVMACLLDLFAVRSNVAESLLAHRNENLQ